MSVKQKQNKKHYLKKDEFVAELRKSKEQDRMTERLGGMFIKLVDNIQKSFVYKNDSDRVDCKSDVLEALTGMWKKCDLDKEGSNAFAYFTQTVENSLYFSWNTLKKNSKDTVYIDGIFKDDNNERN